MASARSSSSMLLLQKEGCGSCCHLDHFFSDCPLRKFAPPQDPATPPKPKELELNVGGDPNSDDENHDWVRVAGKKGGAPSIRIGNPKSELFKHIGANVVYKSDSSSSKLSNRSVSYSSSKIRSGGGCARAGFQAQSDPVEATTEQTNHIPCDDSPNLKPNVNAALALPNQDDDEELLDYEGEDDDLLEDGLADPMEAFSQDEIEEMFKTL